MIKNSIKNFVYVMMLTIICFGGCVGSEDKKQGGNCGTCGEEEKHGGFNITMIGETPVRPNPIKKRVEQLDGLYKDQEVKICALEQTTTELSAKISDLTIREECVKLYDQLGDVKRDHLRLRAAFERSEAGNVQLQNQLDETLMQHKQLKTEVETFKLDNAAQFLELHQQLIRQISAALQHNNNSSVPPTIVINNESSGGNSIAKTGDTTATSSVEQALLGTYPIFYKNKKISLGVLFGVLAFLAQRLELGICSAFLLGYGLYESKESLKAFGKKVIILTGGATIAMLSGLASVHSSNSDDAFCLCLLALGSLGGSVLYCAAT